MVNLSSLFSMISTAYSNVVYSLCRWPQEESNSPFRIAAPICKTSNMCVMYYDEKQERLIAILKLFLWLISWNWHVTSLFPGNLTYLIYILLLNSVRYQSSSRTHLSLAFLDRYDDYTDSWLNKKSLDKERNFRFIVYKTKM